MTKGFVLYVQNFQQELKIFVVSYLEYISAYQLLNQTLPKLRSDLKCIDSQGKEYLDNSLNVIVDTVLL